MREKINLAKYIAVTCNKEREFRNKWKFFLSLIVLCPIQGISCPVVWNVLYSRGVNGKEVILRILFCRESFQMIANDEDKFLPLSLFSHLSQHLLCSFTLFALCRRSVVLAQERSEVKLKLNEIESAMSMFTLSLTRLYNFDNIVMQEPVKHLRRK